MLTEGLSFSFHTVKVASYSLNAFTAMVRFLSLSRYVCVEAWMRAASLMPPAPAAAVLFFLSRSLTNSSSVHSYFSMYLFLNHESSVHVAAE